MDAEASAIDHDIRYRGCRRDINTDSESSHEYFEI